MKFFRTIALTSLVFLCLIFVPNSVFAGNNNKFGIHIINETDLEDAAKLINSNGGEWGYVTLVIREDERDVLRWQSVFDKMRELKLIPLVRLATYSEGSSWKRPTPEDANSWATFLSSLNWVVKDRYIILFNEPNHIGEWGGSINPREYAEVAQSFQKRLKETSADFFILPAGFDSSAPNSPVTMSVDRYWDIMATIDPKLFSIFDGWSSHSYPNPAFSSSPALAGRGSVRSFNWEVNYLGRFGLRQDIPIFITETGWIHNENKENKVLGINSETVGKFFKDAYQRAWSDKRIMAVTPFVLNYPASPFADFSWKKSGSQEYLPHFKVVQEIAKVKGDPEQIHKNTVLEHSFPNKLVTDSDYKFNVKFQNSGQSIWSKDDGFSPDFRINEKTITLNDFLINRARPGESSIVEVNFHSPANPGSYQISINLQHKGKGFGDLLVHSVEVVDPPKLKVSATSLFGGGNGQDLKLLIYKNNDIVKEVTDFSLVEGLGVIDLKDVAPGETYRFVLIKPYHLPVQTRASISIPETQISFPILLPVDRNNDGKLSWEDLQSLVK